MASKRKPRGGIYRGALVTYNYILCMVRSTRRTGVTELIPVHPPRHLIVAKTWLVKPAQRS